MAFVRIDQFTGIAPKVGDKRLKLGAATRAVGTEFELGKIKSRKRDRSIENLRGGRDSLFLYRDQFWFTGTGITYVESPVQQDQHDRVYMVGETFQFPRFAEVASATQGYNQNWNYQTDASLPTVYYRLGINPPQSKPIVTLGDAPTPGDGEELLDVSTSYVYTLVGANGEESAPSNPSAIVSYVEGQPRYVVVEPTTESNVNIAFKRIYRTATGANNTEFLFVDEILYTQSSYIDTKSDAELGEVIVTENHYPPPNDDASLHPSGPLRSLVQHPQGFLVGHTGNTLCFSEPYLPHAWNPNNQLTTKQDIVGIVSGANGIVVGTKGSPYLCTGNTPDSMDLYQLQAEYATASARSMVELNGAVFYASPDGIVAVDGNNVMLMTENIFNKDQWAEYAPSTITAFAYGDRYIGFYTYGDTKAGFVLDPKSSAFYDLDWYAYGGHVASDNTLYLIRNYNQDHNQITAFEQGAAGSANNADGQASGTEPFSYETGKIPLHDGIQFAYIKIVATKASYVTITVTVDNNILANYPVTWMGVYGELVLPLPSGMRGAVFSVAISGDTTLESITLAETREELEP